jgi:hypothetical protein
MTPPPSPPGTPRTLNIGRGGGSEPAPKKIQTQGTLPRLNCCLKQEMPDSLLPAKLTLLWNQTEMPRSVKIRMPHKIWKTLAQAIPMKTHFLRSMPQTMWLESNSKNLPPAIQKRQGTVSKALQHLSNTQLSWAKRQPNWLGRR